MIMLSTQHTTLKCTTTIQFFFRNLKTSQNDEGMQKEIYMKKRKNSNDGRKRKPKFSYKKIAICGGQ